MKRSQTTLCALFQISFLIACSSTDNRPGTGTNNTVVLPDGGLCTPDYSCAPTAPSTGNQYADCVARVNQFRACVCLGPLARNAAAESCANQQAQYDAQTGTAHGGFSDNICTPSALAQNECPGWDSVTQTISGCVQTMFAEGPPPTASCTGTCYSAHGHFINMTNTDYTSVACGFYTTADGKVWQVQNYFR
jgi:hypothetical protein